MLVSNPNAIFSLAQIMGYIAFAITMASCWQKKDKPLFLLNTLSTVFWAIHYAMMDSWVAVMTTILIGLRSALAAYPTNPKYKHITAALFILSFIVVSIFTHKTTYDLIVPFGATLGTISMIYLKDFALRYGLMATLALWLVFAYCLGSFGEMLSDAILIAIYVVTLIRMYRDKKVT